MIIILGLLDTRREITDKLLIINKKEGVLMGGRSYKPSAYIQGGFQNY